MIYIYILYCVMISLKTLPQNQNTQMYNLLTKLDRILRLYRCAKKQSSSHLQEIRIRVDVLMENMRTLNTQKYQKIKDNLNKIIEDSLSQPKLDSKSTSKVASSRHSQSCKSSSNNTPVREEKQENKMTNKQTNKVYYDSSFNTKNSQKDVIRNQSPIQFRHKKQESNEPSISSSTGGNAKDLKSFCHQNIKNLQKIIEINQDVLKYINKLQPNKAALIGVQKPQNINKQKIYLCTLMQFQMQQVTALNFKEDSFIEQLEQFDNVIRYPFALCILGNGISCMKAHFLKFLLQMNSPFPMVIILNQQNLQQSIIVKPTLSCIDSMLKARKIQVLKIDQSFIKTKDLYTSTLFSQIPISKQKFVTTKILMRAQKKKVYENQTAIMVENPKSQFNNKQKNNAGLGTNKVVGKATGLGMNQGLGKTTGLGIESGLGMKTDSGPPSLGMGKTNIGQNKSINLGNSMSNVSNLKVNQSFGSIGISKGAFGTNNTPKIQSAFGLPQKKKEEPPSKPKKQEKQQVLKEIEQKKEQKQEQQKKQPEQCSDSIKLFEYRLHEKYLTFTKQVIHIYFINQNNEFYQRKKYQNLPEAIQYIKQNTQHRFCLQFVKKQKKKVPLFQNQSLIMLFELLEYKIQLFSVKVKSLNSSKVVFFNFKPNISLKDFQGVTIDFKDLQTDTKLTKNLIIINKTNIGKYETANACKQI